MSQYNYLIWQFSHKPLLKNFSNFRIRRYYGLNIFMHSEFSNAKFGFFRKWSGVGWGLFDQRIPRFLTFLYSWLSTLEQSTPWIHSGCRPRMYRGRGRSAMCTRKTLSTEKKNEFGIQMYKICKNWNDFTLLGIGAMHVRHEEDSIIFFLVPWKIVHMRP